MYRVKIKRNIAIQAGHASIDSQNKETQCELLDSRKEKGSYQRQVASKDKHLTYDELVQNFLCNNTVTIQWLKDIGLLASETLCPMCRTPMMWTPCKDRSDGFKYECRGGQAPKRHRVEQSIRRGSWFEKNNLTLQEIMKITYWWCADLRENQIKAQLRINPNTIVDWSMFCREICELSIIRRSEQLGGEGVRVQIDQTKVGKRKYHRGHLVEGQWVFGAIEEDSRKCFIAPVEDRTENTLVSLIRKWVKPGSIIVSDCWKGYINLNKYGYVHETVNHSQEFVNDAGGHTNKIEGHWRQLKSSLPTHGRRKHHYPSYFAEFMWRYVHKDEDLFTVFLEDIKHAYNFQTHK
jgi:hypothetical protein